MTQMGTSAINTFARNDDFETGMSLIDSVAYGFFMLLLEGLTTAIMQPEQLTLAQVKTADRGDGVHRLALALPLS